ncbi:MAG: ketol-acid reductoisomerase, partial [Tissierellia bacterium]|nr:ketol-acid reductoisomerase [Tissierellia bacterium]
ERYQEIEDGTFNKEWLMELDNKLVNFEEMREAAYNNEISLSEEEYRKRLK